VRGWPSALKLLQPRADQGDALNSGVLDDLKVLGRHLPGRKRDDWAMNSVAGRPKHRNVEDGHEHRDADERKRLPAAGVVLGGRVS